MLSSVLLLHLILATGQLLGQSLSAVDEVDRPGKHRPATCGPRVAKGSFAPLRFSFDCLVEFLADTTSDGRRK